MSNKFLKISDHCFCIFFGDVTTLTELEHFLAACDTLGALGRAKTVEPFAEKVFATVVFRP
ncbi:hypothetical protein [Leptolyngbya sp. 7M]|uniref:hypothetical protein n=1 Tax=Leptolyngbya sp. 7M TaxID=2812896 RepID=UPI001B8CEB79|nr:hypothetical protein [Leptolyngbya sp. 7M]QYO66240.1 hypothetical protein JVX88_05420 [Leptolyngbya sp. 7M]